MQPDNPRHESKQILSLAEQDSDRYRHPYLGIERIFIILTKVNK